MDRNQRKILSFFATICLPIFIISTPNWLKINGISPCWPVILLLPFTLKNVPWRSAIAAVALGLYSDSFTVSDASHVPSLLLLSLMWSQYALHNKKVELYLNIGLMAMLGTVLVGFSMWVQKIIFYSILRNDWFHSWSLYVLICEVVMTGLVAPIFSSWLLFTYKKN